MTISNTLATIHIHPRRVTMLGAIHMGTSSTAAVHCKAIVVRQMVGNQPLQFSGRVHSVVECGSK